MFLCNFGFLRILKVVNFFGFMFWILRIWIVVCEKLYCGVLGVFFMKRMMGVEVMVLLMVEWVWLDNRCVCWRRVGVWIGWMGV